MSEASEPITVVSGDGATSVLPGEDSVYLDTIESADLELVLTKMVREVEDVADVFSPVSVVGQLPEVLGALVGRDPDRVNRVRLSTGADGTNVATRISVDRSGSAPTTARDVASALLAASAPLDGDITISVQVSRIS